MRFNTIDKTEEDLDKELLEKYRTTDDIEYLRRNVLHLRRCVTTNHKFQQRLLKLGQEVFDFEETRWIDCDTVLSKLEDYFFPPEKEVVDTPDYTNPFQDGLFDLQNPDDEDGEVFTKFDSGKAPLYLLAQFKEELGDVAHVLMSGAEKYGMDNWKKCDDSSRYYSAGLRHYFQYIDGEMLDEESGKPHAVHVIVNLLFSLYLDNKLKKESKE